MQEDMPKNYLWALGSGLDDLEAGTLIADRYLYKGGRILIDTRPELLPELPGNDVTAEPIACYLKLFAHRLHVPQVYGWISPPAAQVERGIWLLEKGPVDRKTGKLRPRLTDLWGEAPAMRQLNWLWQIAKLWYASNREGVASSWLDPDLLRVEGPLVRLLELQQHPKGPSLEQLGSLWQTWIPRADRRIQSFLDQLTRQMIDGELRKSERLVDQLDRALVICGRSLDRRVDIVTVTDAGPTRSHNEDACYPEGDTSSGIDGELPALAIVCDGIGGQEGGEVASGLAIEIVREQIEKMPLHPANWDPLSVTPRLKRAISIANDAISDRNDSEDRQGRQRMGTTLVMALAHVHEIYLTHIGDSRAYWITREGCHQVTLDDDVASREVRLGYTIYREALQQVASGALIQAMGITHSMNLHPTIQRFPIDEDCIFLLCSDGLSDRDRVEQYWETEIRPALEGKSALATVRDRLLHLANTQNGHDNVTIALLHFRLTPKGDGEKEPEISVPPVASLPDDTLGDSSSDITASDESAMETELIVVDKDKTRQIWWLSLGILLLIAIAGLSVWIVLRGLFSPEAQPTSSKDPSPISPDPSPTPASPQPAIIPYQPQPLQIKAIVQLGPANAPDGAPSPRPIRLLEEFGKPYIKGQVPNNSVFQILERQTTPDAGTWMELKICSVPPESGETAADFPNFEGDPNGWEVEEDISPAGGEWDDPETAPTGEILTLRPGDLGWMTEDDIYTRLLRNSDIPPDRLGSCQPPGE